MAAHAAWSNRPKVEPLGAFMIKQPLGKKRKSRIRRRRGTPLEHCAKLAKVILVDVFLGTESVQIAG